MVKYYFKSRIVALFLILLPSGFLKAQDIASPLAWTVDSLTDLSTNERFEYTCTFKTNGSNDIVWIQSGGFVSAMRIVSTTGSWGNIMETGRVVYAILYDGETGTLTTERNAAGVQITLELSQTGSTTLRQKFTVSAITQIP